MSVSSGPFIVTDKISNTSQKVFLPFTTVCVEELMEVLQELLDFQGTRTVQLIVSEAEQHVNLKINASETDNVLSTIDRYKTTCTSVF